MMNKRAVSAVVALTIVLGISLPLYAQGSPDLREQVRHEIVMLPYYQIFDRIEFSVEGDTVTLSGEVTRPVLKADAEKAVMRIPGIKTVKNEISVLPYSPYDDAIRSSVFRAIYYNPNFNRYALRSRGPIHILVNNGDVTLVGAVLTETDRNIAGMLARGVSGVFHVNNELSIGV